MMWGAVFYAVFVWWFSTGAILFIVSRADVRGDFVMPVVMAVPVLLLGTAGVVASLDDPSVLGAFMAFTAALFIWGWFEMAFLAGILTGPNAEPTPVDARGWERFIRAWGAIAYSEMALVMTGVMIALLSVGAENKFALWTYLVLFGARILAKLNLHLGVPNINDDFLPRPIRHLTSHFRRAPMNAFFPISVTTLTLALAFCIERALAMPAGSGAEIGFVLLAALTALALFEHWVMVLPVPDAALWRWLLPSPDTNHKTIPSSAAPAAQERIRHGL